MKTQHGQTHKRQAINFAVLILLAAGFAGFEIWKGQFAILGYFALITLTPLIVLFSSDLFKAKGHRTH